MTLVRPRLNSAVFMLTRQGVILGLVAKPHSTGKRTARFHCRLELRTHQSGYPAHYFDQFIGVGAPDSEAPCRRTSATHSDMLGSRRQASCATGAERGQCLD